MYVCTGMYTIFVCIEFLGPKNTTKNTVKLSYRTWQHFTENKVCDSSQTLTGAVRETRPKKCICKMEGRLKRGL